MAEFYAQLFNGLVLGLLFGVIALGFMLILGVMEVINFSHGALFALGAYFALTLQPYLGYWAALIIAPLVVGIIGLFIEWTAVRRIYGKDPLLGLLMTLGLAMVFEEIGDGRRPVGDAMIGTRHANREQTGTERVLAENERRASGRAALLRVVVREHGPFFSDAIDVGRSITHQAVTVGTDVGNPHVVAPDDQDVRSRRLCYGYRG